MTAACHVTCPGSRALALPTHGKQGIDCAWICHRRLALRYPFRSIHSANRCTAHHALPGLSPYLLGLSLAKFAGENLAEMMPDILVDAPSFEGSLLNPTREAAQNLHSREAVSHMPPTPVAAHLEGLIPVLIKAGMSRYASLQSQPSKPAPSQRAAKPEPQLVKPEAKPGALLLPCAVFPHLQI